jgi:ABC-type transport system substrate-binding protein
VWPLRGHADSSILLFEGIAREDSKAESDVCKVICGQQGRCRIAVFFALALFSGGCARGRDRQTVVVLIESSPANLDPRIGTDAESERIGSLIFDSLLRRDRQGNLLPGLAERWETPDPLTYIFHLRQDARFHNGKAVTAQDVRYSFESLLSGEVQSLKASTFNLIASVETPDRWTVVVRLKQPFASFLWNVSQGGFAVVPEGAGREFARAPVGSGPFRFVSAIQDQNVTLERNPDYWGERARIARVEFRVVPDATSRALELRKGSADVEFNALTADMVATLSGVKSLGVARATGESYQYLAFNLENRTLTRAVRQAIAYGIDREAMIQYLWRGMARPADSVLPPENWAHAQGLAVYAYDPEAARKLLDEAGLRPGPDGVRLRLAMKTSTDQTARELAAALQDQLRRIGVALEIRPFEFATFYADINRSSFDLYSLRWISGNDDPDILSYLFDSRRAPPEGANRGHYSNRDVDQLLTETRSATDLDERRKKYAAVQRILADDLPYVSLWYLDDVAVYNRRLRNLKLAPTGNYDFLREVEVEDGGGPLGQVF